MPTIEQAERVSGAAFISVPIFDFIVFVLDNYARLELLVNLRAELPKFLVNPVVGFLCMCIGLCLLQLSHKREIERIFNRPSKLVGVDSYREAKKTTGWLLLLIYISIGLIVTTPLLAVVYSLRYRGMPPASWRLAHAPAICKTEDCSPQKSAIIYTPIPLPQYMHHQVVLRLGR